MSTDYIPKRESQLSIYVSNFSALLTANPGAYGVTAADAAGVAAVVNAFNTALALAVNPSTSTQSLVADKDAKKAAMLVIVRRVAMIIKMDAGVSNDLKLGLGLNVNTHGGGPRPAPSSAPLINPVAATSLAQVIRYADATNPDKRAKPANVKALMLFCAVGTTPPATPEAMPLKAMATRQPVMVQFGPADAGKTAYYYGRWASESGLMGPWSALASMGVTA